MRGCAPGNATVTVEVRLAGANSAAASVSQHVTVLPIPDYVWAEFGESAEEAMQSVRDAFARGGAGAAGAAAVPAAPVRLRKNRHHDRDHSELGDLVGIGPHGRRGDNRLPDAVLAAL